MATKSLLPKRLIGVVIRPSGSYWMSVVRGIQDTARRWPDTHVALVTSQNPQASSSSDEIGSTFSAFIARANGPSLIESLRATGRPVVNVSTLEPHTPFPLVTVDNKNVGIMGAEHLLSVGLRRFAFCGDSSGFSTDRAAGFAKTVVARGMEYHPLAERSGSEPWCNDIQRIMDRAPGSPLGVMAANDDAAASIINRLSLLGVDVPRSVAVLGVDNEELALNRCSPLLSSIEIPTYEIGCEAMRLVMRMLEGETHPSEPILLPPVRVVARASTDIIAFGDAGIRSTVEFIRKNAHRTVTVTEALSASDGMTKRTLQRRFLDVTGSTIQKYIHSARLEHAKGLLRMEDISVKQVAYESGFSSPSVFVRFFRQREGVSPMEYKDKHSRKKT